MDSDGSEGPRKESMEQPSAKELLKEFSSYTTTHGIGRLAETKTRLSRLLWTGFILGAFAMFFVQVYHLFDLYYSRPVSTTISLRHATTVTFPAVTVCNKNIIKSDLMSEYLLRKETLERKKESDPPTADVQSPLQNTSSSAENGTEKSASFTYELRKHLTIMKVTDLKSMGHQFQDLVIHCNFRDIDCSNYSKYWYSSWDIDHGNCFTFNGGVDDNNDNQTVLKTDFAGSVGGLELVLYIDSFNYISELTSSIGARIVVHDQFKSSLPGYEGDDVQPGKATSIGVQKEIIQKVDRFKNGSCKEDKQATYKQTECLRACIRDFQIKNCGCADRRFVEDPGLACLTFTNETLGKCLHDLSEQQILWIDSCHTKCPSPCRETLFTSTLSNAEWPSPGHFKRSIVEEIFERSSIHEEEKKKLDLDTFVQENFLLVRIYFKRLDYREVKEELTYKEVNLLADIGGQLGLWIGISVLTCIEWLELVLVLVQNMFKTMKDKRSKVSELRLGENAVTTAEGLEAVP